MSEQNAQNDTVRIHESDNVVVLIRSATAGEVVVVDDRRVTLARDLGLGHKLAAREIAPGEKVIKYGLPIGSASGPIAFGEHVHVHNLESDYLRTFTHDAEREFREGG